MKTSQYLETLNTNGRLANLELTSFVKDATVAKRFRHRRLNECNRNFGVTHINKGTRHWRFDIILTWKNKMNLHHPNGSTCYMSLHLCMCLPDSPTPFSLRSCTLLNIVQLTLHWHLSHTTLFIFSSFNKPKCVNNCVSNQGIYSTPISWCVAYMCTLYLGGY